MLQASGMKVKSCDLCGEYIRKDNATRLSFKQAHHKCKNYPCVDIGMTLSAVLKVSQPNSIRTVAS